MTLKIDKDGVHLSIEYWNSILKQIADLEEENERLRKKVEWYIRKTGIHVASDPDEFFDALKEGDDNVPTG